jgi:hypothetical protein
LKPMKTLGKKCAQHQKNKQELGENKYLWQNTMKLYRTQISEHQIQKRIPSPLLIKRKLGLLGMHCITSLTALKFHSELCSSLLLAKANGRACIVEKWFICLLKSSIWTIVSYLISKIFRYSTLMFSMVCKHTTEQFVFMHSWLKVTGRSVSRW